jgi:hypothetical protein
VRTLPGTADPERVFVRWRLGVPVVGVVTVLQSGGSPGVVAHAVLPIAVTPAGRGLSTVRANCAEAEEPAASGGSVSVQVLPGPFPGAQVQPALLAPAAKVVLGGIVSVSGKAPAPWLPTLATPIE